MTDHPARSTVVGWMLALVVAGCGTSGDDANSSDTASSSSDGDATADTPSGDSSGIEDAGLCDDSAIETCFEHGSWLIMNLSPCLFSDAIDAVPDVAVSTIVVDGQARCPDDLGRKPVEPWSTSTLVTNCAGHYRLCLTLGANAVSGGADECVFAESCAEGDYLTPDVAQTWTPLPSWIAADDTADCVRQFATNGGFGEMRVEGESFDCGTIARTLKRIVYCPLACSNPRAQCDCVPDSSGAF